MPGENVAVIGCGIAGLTALKNFLEEDFKVTAFDGRGYVGGLWKYTDQDEVSVLPTTISNVSKFKNAFTDFPPSKEYPAHLTAVQVQEYLESYANHFNLYQHIRLDTVVEKVVRDRDDSTWELHIRQNDGTREVLLFDRVAVCTNPFSKPKIPHIEGQDIFKGRIIHSRAFKNPKEFDGVQVLVLGLGNTAADTCTDLVGHAKKIYLSHRRGCNLFARTARGKPLDLVLTRRRDTIQRILDAWVPSLSRRLRDFAIQNLTREIFPDLDQDWRIHPPPSIVSHQPVISDHLVANLQSGNVTSVQGVSRITGPETVQLSDSTTLTGIDAIILCTGYLPDFTLFPNEDPTTQPPTGWLGAPYADSQIPPRLYQNIFPPHRAQSVAYLNSYAFTTGICPVADLTSMAVAQVWRGNTALPAESDMNRAIDAHHRWVTDLAHQDSVYWNIIREGPWIRFMHDAAGTGVNENLGYGPRGWLFWARQPSFCNLLMTGVDSPYLFRLFDAGRPGGRKRWEGARAAIEENNRCVRELYGK